MTFEDWVARIEDASVGNYEWHLAVEHALAALAAERAEARKAQAAQSLDELARIDAPLIGEPSTPYTRAMTAPRMGGQHPHDGRHIMSMRHWGMV